MFDATLPFKTIAHAVDDLVSDQATMDRFRAMVREWQKDREAECHGASLQDDPHRALDEDGEPLQPSDKALLLGLPMPITPKGEARKWNVYVPDRLARVCLGTLPEKYAALAAVRDAFFGDRRIDPWANARDDREGALEGAAYNALLSHVGDLSEDDRPRLEAALEDVRRDLTTFPALSAAADPALPPARQAADPPTVDKPTTDVHPATLAKAILFEEPEISPTELAKRVGVSKGTLYTNSPKWRDVAKTLRARNRGAIPKGSKSADGDIDAEHPSRDRDDQ